MSLGSTILPLVLLPTGIVFDKDKVDREGEMDLDGLKGG
jgi:hypothetical protein